MTRPQWLRMLLLVLLFTFLTAQAPSSSSTRASYDPELEALLLQNGYQANIISIRGTRGLRASQRNYTSSVWSRDLDYAISGYGYALSDMTIFRDNIALFLKHVDEYGIVPETITPNLIENRQSWDSMPNIIHASYVYVAKSGDWEFYRQQREKILRVAAWIYRLDNDGDGSIDRADFPYGYYDSLFNGVQHTYAIARFYGAFLEIAELENASGNDGQIWNERAARLRTAFHRPVEQGGYWRSDQTWPIAWYRDDGNQVRQLETFGVFYALRSGLIAPSDGGRYHRLVNELHRLLPDLIDGPTPMRLALGGYESDLRRVVDPPVPVWMLDGSAPWIVGLAAPAYAEIGFPQDAQRVMDAYNAMARATNPPVLEFAAGPNACYGEGNTGDGGRTWDSAAWFMAVYGGHYGLTFRPSYLEIQPRPFMTLPNDNVQNLTYQGALIQLQLDSDTQTYRVQSDKAIEVLLRPMGSALQIQIDGAAAVSGQRLQLEAGRSYSVRSLGQPDPSTLGSALRADRSVYDCRAFREVWKRSDQPLLARVSGLQARSWLWGPQPITGARLEPYAEGRDGVRLVQYYDKSRMEINNPDAPLNAQAVTNGLLVLEMIEGRIQVGDSSFVAAQPSDQAIAGDPVELNPDAPRYRSFRSVSYPVNPSRAPERLGQTISEQIDRDGKVSENQHFAQYALLYGGYDQSLGHNIPKVFLDYFSQQGIVYEQGRYQQGQIVDWMFVVGLPISEPYWARVRVGGQERDILIQAFQRRVLTYSPQNDPAWRVEMGNVGQHYLRWRYDL
jgi:hypothetical protein